MRRTEREIHDPLLVEALLCRAEYIHLGLWDGTSPYVVAVNFGYKDGAVYFHSALEGKKIECLRRCDRVCFEAVLNYELVRATKACGYTAHFKSVVGLGRAVFLEDQAEKVEGMNTIMRYYRGPEIAFSEATLARTAVVRIDVETLTGKANPPWQGDELAEVIENEDPDEFYSTAD